MRILCWEVSVARTGVLCCFKMTILRRDQTLLSPNKVGEEDGSGIAMEDTDISSLMARPSKVDSTLEDNLLNWETAIHAYRELESTLLDTDDSAAILTVLVELRESPEKFLAESYASCVRDLATKRCIIYSCQARLGLPREQQKSERNSAKVADHPIHSTPRLQPKTRPSDPLVHLVNSSMRKRDINEPSSLPLEPAMRRKGSRNGRARGSYTDTISQAWAERLSQVIPAQGSFQLDPKSKQGQVLPAIRPKWPQYLPDAWYEVVKVGRLARRQRRLLKLTEYHVLSIKGGNALSKIYLYLEVAQIWLQGTNMAVLVLRSGKHLSFMCPMAASLVQQITARVQVRTALENTVFFSHARASAAAQGANNRRTVRVSGVTDGSIYVGSDPQSEGLSRRSSMAPVDSLVGGSNEHSQFGGSVGAGARATISPSLSFAVTQQLIESISEENDVVAHDVLAAFASSLRDRAKSRHISKAFNSGKLAAAMVAGSGLDDTNLHSPSSPSALKLHASNVTSLALSKSSSSDEAVSTSVEPPPPPQPVGGSPASDRAKSGCLNLLALGGQESPERRVQEELRRIFHDEATAEGNTRRLFIDAFLAGDALRPSKSLLELRLFVDGLHEYALDARGTDLARLLRDDGEREREREGRKSDGFATSSTIAMPGRSQVPGRLAGYLSRARSSTLGGLGLGLTLGRTARLSSISVPSPGPVPGSLSFPNALQQPDDSSTLDYIPPPTFVSASPPPSPSPTSSSPNAGTSSAEIDCHWSEGLPDGMADTLSFLVFAAAEESVYSPLDERVVAQLSANPATAAEDALFAQRIPALGSLSQEELGVDPKHVSALSWETSVFELAGLERASTPSLKLFALVRAFKAIYAEFKQAVVPDLLAGGASHADCLLGADGLVPIFIFVLCSSQLRRPALYRELLWQLCHPDQLHGEAGYFLTVYESAVSFVLTGEGKGKDEDEDVGELEGGRATNYVVEPTRSTDSPPQARPKTATFAALFSSSLPAEKAMQQNF